MEAFEELTKVLSVARESPHINFHKQGCFVMFPRPSVSNLISSEFYPDALWFTMKWVREGKKFWFIESLDSEIRAIEIPGQDPDPVYPNSKWAQYLSLIYCLIGGLWREDRCVSPAVELARLSILVDRWETDAWELRVRRYQPILQEETQVHHNDAPGFLFCVKPDMLHL